MDIVRREYRVRVAVAVCMTENVVLTRTDGVLEIRLESAGEEERADTR